MIRKIVIATLLTGTLISLVSCFGGKKSMRSGGEVMGARSVAINEPTPYGMVKIERGFLRTGLSENDTLWGNNIPQRNISVDGFWMDQTEVTNSMYRQFVEWVRDSIIRERLADPAYGGDELYKITEDKYGEPVKPHLNWERPLPRKPDEDQLRAIESMYHVDPIDGRKMINFRQLNYRYEVYDYEKAALRKYRMNPSERDLNTDHSMNRDEVVMISKDTAYINDEGKIIRETIERPRTGPWDFLNTYIVNVYPDTTCWINDFPNAHNEVYMKNYFDSPAYNDYPVVGVTWEQAKAFCAWRTNYLLRNLGPQAKWIQRYRLPSEIEWEYAARGKEQNPFPWKPEDTDTTSVRNAEGCFYANFKPTEGNYTEDGHLITNRVGIFGANSNGLYDMAGNVAEWTNTVYTDAGVLSMADINPQLVYDAAKEDPYALKRKTVRGGSWKDPITFIQSAWRTKEYQNQPRSYIGFRCVRSFAGAEGMRIRKNKKRR